MNKTPLLRVEHLFCIIGGKTLVNDISFQADGGKVTVFLGPNGAGKTTLLKAVIGLNRSALIQDKKSHIILDDKELLSLPIHKRVEAGLVYVPQQTSLFRYLTVDQNLNLVYEHHPYWQKQERSLFEQEKTTLLEQTTLIESRNQQTRLLSGGQQRKAEVIRALLMHPKVVLFDEPFAGVDPKSIYELKKLFTAIADQGIAVIISDHHVDQLLSIAQTIYVIMSGTVMTSGSIKEVLANQLFKERYLGSQFHAEVSERFLS
jgi:lipopolysaccharide export system ATP-binding protein